MTRGWDAIVVGAGVAGAATAMLLARAGSRVLCLDQGPRHPALRSTQVLVRGGVLQLQSWGLLADLVAAGTPPVRRTVVSYGAESMAVSIKGSAGVDALYAPRRPVIDAVLIGAADRAGAAVRSGSRATGVYRDRDGVVAGVRVQDSHSRAGRVVRAPLVIGADGRESVIARDVAAGPVSVNQPASSVLYGYWANLPTDGFESCYRSGLSIGIVPTNSGLTCVYIGGRANRIGLELRGDTASAAFDRLAAVAGLDARLASAQRAEPVRGACALPAGYLRPAYGPGWALVGYAGHWIDPLSLHGTTAALRDAALLVRAVLAEPPGNGLPGEALAEYQSIRDRLSLPMIRATDEIAAGAWDLVRIRVLLRNLASATADEVEALTLLGTVA